MLPAKNYNKLCKSYLVHRTSYLVHNFYIVNQKKSHKNAKIFAHVRFFLYLCCEFKSNQQIYTTMMKKFFDESGSLNMDDLIMERPSFQHLMKDGVVTDEKIDEQGQRVKEMILQMDPNFTPEQKDQIYDLVAEFSVLLTLASISDQQG